ncbi:unnamed protein product [Sphagnum compactum]
MAIIVPKITVSKSFTSYVERSDRVIKVAEAFGIGLDDREFKVFENLELDINPGEVVFVTGQSGSGKSCLLREIVKSLEEKGLKTASLDDVVMDNRPIIDQLGKDMLDATQLLALAGISDAYLFIRKPQELSDGQRYRFKLAKLLEAKVDCWVADEFGAVLDRVTAKVVSYNLARASRKHGKTLIVATTHDDITAELAPNITIRKRYQDRIDVARRLHYKSHGTLTPGSHYFRMMLNDELIGIIMMASPKMLLKERHIMFPSLKPGHDTRITNTARMKWINANMSITARVVVDTMYRGAGLAYRFTNLASRMEGKKFIEIQSSMSKYNQFAQKAGYQFTPPVKATKFDLGIKFFRATFDANPADTQAILNEIESLPPAAKERTLEQVRAFYRRHSSIENTGKGLIKNADGVKFADTRIARLPTRTLIEQLQQMVLASPLYGIYINPDFGRQLPERLPILAFDKQPPDQPLIL